MRPRFVAGGILVAVAFFVVAAAVQIFNVTVTQDYVLYDPDGTNFFRANSNALNLAVRPVADGVTNVEAASTVPSLGFSGSPITRSGTLTLTGSVSGTSISGTIPTNVLPGMLPPLSAGDAWGLTNYNPAAFSGFSFHLMFGSNSWRQSIVAVVTNGGIELPVLEWTKTTNLMAAFYYDLAFGGGIWRTSITNTVLSGGFELPVFEMRKL